MKPHLSGVRAITFLAPLCAGLIAAHATAADEAWLTNFEAAKKAAAEQKKDLLIDFTGSDWCSWCKKLDKEVFAENAFKTEAGKKFIFVSLDFPQLKKQSDSEKAQNGKLQTDFAVEGFPTVFLADAEGRPYARTGYQAGGPESYLKHLDSFSAGRAARDKGFAAAAKSQGLEKAAHLKAALDALPDHLGSLPAYAAVARQIDELDKEDALGLRKAAAEREASQKLGKELEQLAQDGKRDQIVKRVDDYLSTHPLEGDAKQTVLFMKLMSYGRDDTEAVTKVLDEVIAVKPNSEAGRQALTIKERLKTVRPKAAPARRSGAVK
jgi:thioredoxin-related protein